MKRAMALTGIVLCTLLFAAGRTEAKHPRQRSRSSSPPSVGGTDAEPNTKTVRYGEKDVVKLRTKVRFTTLIVLPQNEQVVDFTCGDRDFWVVEGHENFAYVKPAKEGSSTNLNLTTASGNFYTFVLVEISNVLNAEPDLKVFVEPKEPSLIGAAGQPPRFVSSSELAGCRGQIDAQNQEIRRLQQAVQVATDGQLSKFLSETKFTYHFNPDKRPFHVKAIYHDTKFTYIKAEPEETPTLYEVRDGKPNLVNFEYKDGVYVAEKIIDRGYLAIGKSRLLFVRREEQ